MSKHVLKKYLFFAQPGDMNIPNPFFDDTDSGSFEEEGNELTRDSSQSYRSSFRGSQRSDFNSPEILGERHGM